ncbi:MAG TPA: SHOCT domain-containing protein [Candidatus Brocadiia bacterium]|nr:SHOCT domain-containing protein [Candidatus Brocadiia bacterium]
MRMLWMGVMAAAVAAALASSCPAQTASSVESKLKALEAARDAGVLTQEEYARKKAEIEAAAKPPAKPAAPAVDAETQKKLETLERLRAEGVISEEMYQKKKKELMPAAPKAETPAAPVSPAEQAVEAGRYQDPEGRFHFSYPKAWISQELPNGAGVRFAAGQATMAVSVGIANTDVLIENAARDLLGAKAKPMSRIERPMSGLTGVLAEYDAVDGEGRALKAEIVAVKGAAVGFALAMYGPSAAFDAAQGGWNLALDTFTVNMAKTQPPTPAAKTKGKGVLEGFGKTNAPEPKTTGPDTPACKTPEPQTPEPAAAPPKTMGPAWLAQAKTFTHPTGYSFQYPAAWQVEQMGNDYRLTPADTQMDAAGPSELYFTLTEQAYNISNPGDQAVVQYFDSRLRSTLPFVQLAGQVEPAQARCGQGAVITWAGVNPMGRSIRARAYVALLPGRAIALIGFGYQDVIAAREGTLKEIFATFGAAGAGPGGAAW